MNMIPSTISNVNVVWYDMIPYMIYDTKWYMIPSDIWYQVIYDTKWYMIPSDIWYQVIYDTKWYKNDTNLKPEMMPNMLP